MSKNNFLKTFGISYIHVPLIEIVYILQNDLSYMYTYV